MSKKIDYIDYIYLYIKKKGYIKNKIICLINK